MDPVYTYQTIAARAEGIFKERGSTFVGIAFPVVSEAEVKLHLQEIKKEHFKCNHHCYAFRLLPDGSVYRSSDDSEPSGSAGKPILGQLLSHQLTFTFIVVARYFGGSLLGVPGLIHAYRSAAAAAISNAIIINQKVNVKVQLQIPYLYLNECMTALKQEPHIILEQEYNDPVTLLIEISPPDWQHFTDKIRNTSWFQFLLIETF